MPIALFNIIYIFSSLIMGALFLRTINIQNKSILLKLLIGISIFTSLTFARLSLHWLQYLPIIIFSIFLLFKYNKISLFALRNYNFLFRFIFFTLFLGAWFIFQILVVNNNTQHLIENRYFIDKLFQNSAIIRWPENSQGIVWLPSLNNVQLFHISYFALLSYATQSWSILLGQLSDFILIVIFIIGIYELHNISLTNKFIVVISSFIFLSAFPSEMPIATLYLVLMATLFYSDFMRPNRTKSVTLLSLIAFLPLIKIQLLYLSIFLCVPFLLLYLRNHCCPFKKTLKLLAIPIVLLVPTVLYFILSPQKFN